MIATAALVVQVVQRIVGLLLFLTARALARLTALPAALLILATLTALALLAFAALAALLILALTTTATGLLILAITAALLLLAALLRRLFLLALLFQATRPHEFLRNRLFVQTNPALDVTGLEAQARLDQGRASGQVREALLQLGVDRKIGGLVGDVRREVEQATRVVEQLVHHFVKDDPLDAVSGGVVVDVIVELVHQIVRDEDVDAVGEGGLGNLLQRRVTVDVDGGLLQQQRQQAKAWHVDALHGTRAAHPALDGVKLIFEIKGCHQAGPFATTAIGVAGKDGIGRRIVDFLDVRHGSKTRQRKGLN